MAREEGKRGWREGLTRELASGRHADAKGLAALLNQDAEFLDVSSGNPAMDALHHAFFESLEHLSVASDREFQAHFGRFVAYVEQAFRQEEEWMDEVDPSDLLAHREQHARVLSALHNVHMRVAEGDLTLGRTVVDQLLPQWFALHMATMDAELANAMQLNKRQRVSADSAMLN